MRTKVYAYKNFIGIESSPKIEGLLNKPEEKGQLGFVLNAEYVDISPEALQLLKTMKTSCDDIGEVDCFKASKNRIIFSWIGGPRKIVDVSNQNCTCAKDTNFNLLKATKVDPPKEFVEFIDENYINSIISETKNQK